MIILFYKIKNITFKREEKALNLILIKNIK